MFIVRKKAAFIAVIALLFAGSCSRIENPILQDGSGNVMSLTVEASWGDFPETKTEMQSSGAIYWSPNDAINLFYGNANSGMFSTDISAPSPTASFNGSISVATGSSEQGVSTQTFWGVYPYDMENSCDGTGVTMTIPSYQGGVPGSFASNLNPSVANSPGLNLAFYNVGSWFLFSVVSEGITSVSFRGNNGEDLVGKVHVTMDASSLPSAEVLEGESVIFMSPEDGGSFVPGEHYYMVLLPQTLQNGYTFTMYKGDNAVATRVVSSSKTFGRSKYVPGNRIDGGLQWRELYVDMGDNLKWATMNVGADKPEAAGFLLAWGETMPKDSYTWENYKFGDNYHLTKYVLNSSYGTPDNLKVLESGDDAASVYMGGDWRMPSDHEIQWLIDNCTWTATSLNGMPGFQVTSNVNNKSIFLPTPSEAGAWYWSSELTDNPYPSEQSARMLTLNHWDGTHYPTFGPRNNGYMVRGVRGVSSSTIEYVLLGPDVRWATKNVGATSPEDCGNYYAWGETSPKASYSWTTYKWGNSPSTLTKYVLDESYGTMDGRQTLQASDDAATANWGGNWRTPTIDDWHWLENNCTRETVTQNGVQGYRYTSNLTGYEGRSIFIPFAGVTYNSAQSGVGSYAFYWSSEVGLDASSGAYRVDGYTPEDRCIGLPVRAVFIPRVPVTGYSITESSVTVGQEMTYQLYANVTPSNATERGAVWTSSNPSVAKVNCAGVVTGVGVGTATITAVSVDGAFSSTCTVNVIQSYVDMGGGMEWATFNVGAQSPEDYGYYFAWGENSPKGSYSWSTYRWGSEDNPWIYNATDGYVILKPTQDAATVMMKGLWHTPTVEEWNWLIETCNKEEVTLNNVTGYRLTSIITGNSIFLPKAGYMTENGLEYDGYSGKYWSSQVTEGNYSHAYRPEIMGGYYEYGGTFHAETIESRYQGFTVRAVRRQWVDMGDGLKWATTNIGSFYPGDVGDSFAWGETAPKEEYDWSSYKWGNSSTTLTKYVTDGVYGTVDGRSRLISADDAASANWGATWRMPTFDEWKWLKNNCTWVTATENGVSGRRVTSNITGNSIFLPSSGTPGIYWTSSLDQTVNSSALELYFHQDSYSNVLNLFDADRCNGLSVRAVSD